MPYVELRIEIYPYDQNLAEILVANLAEFGFESFSDLDDGLLAYIIEDKLNVSHIEKIIKDVHSQSSALRISHKRIEDQNWNALWESNFEPIAIEKLCRIRAPFHQSESGYDLEIIIEPKMSFGTGHHQTTWLMVREMFEVNFKGKRVLDMGCGTGILAIAAQKLGATKVDAIDIDSWAVSNTHENIAANGCSQIAVSQGDVTVIKGKVYDIILANINLNVLLADLNEYSKSISKQGVLILSGILVGDIPTITAKAKSVGFTPVETKNLNNWAMLKFFKT